MTALLRVARGVAAAVRARPLTFVAAVTIVFLLHALLPALVLSAVRKPWTYFTFNPWLKNLPAYLTSEKLLSEKLDFMSRVAVYWFSADGAFGAPEWGFAVDVLDLMRFLVMSLLIGAYVVLWMRRSDHRVPAAVVHPDGRRARRGFVARSSGVGGGIASVLGLSTGPCSVMGCGAPVLPVVGLAFAGLTSGTLALLSSLSRVAAIVTFVALAGAVLYLGWLTAPGPRARPIPPRASEPHPAV